jgi:hypothetical protein
MNHKDLLRIERQARRMRAELVASFVRGIFRRGPRVARGGIWTA